MFLRCMDLKFMEEKDLNMKLNNKRKKFLIILNNN